MDAAEILGAAPRAEFKVRTRPLEGDPKAKGLKGLNREVYALTGSTEVVEKTTTAPVFGKKRRLAHKQVQWEWLTFSSSARPDLDLKHWQKKGVQKEDYPFAKFNKHLTLVVYSDDEYAKLLENEGWTREKTDKLMKMVQRFDMNFVVIQDRWDGGEGGGGSVEILKDRFYSVQRVLTESRGTEEAAKDKEAETENILLTKPFNRQYEEDRKSAQEKAFTRSPDMDKAEQDILDKARKIESRIKKVKSSDPSRKKPLEDSGPVFAKGGVTLRSTIMHRGVLEKKNMAAVLEHIGLHYVPTVQATEEGYKGLAVDVANLLSLYQKLVGKSGGEEDDAPQKRKRQNPLSAGGGEGAPPPQKKFRA